VAPREKANHAFVLLNEEEFPWRLTSQGRELLIEHGNNNYGSEFDLLLRILSLWMRVFGACDSEVMRIDHAIASLSNLPTSQPPLCLIPSLMLEIPELDDMICRQLRRCDLVQCIRVNKSWHRACLPYLWHNMTVSWSKGIALRRMVLDSYLHERQHQKEDERDVENAQGRTSLSTLAQYGRWVRMLPDPESLFLILQRRPIAKSQRTPAEQHNDPTAHELLRHLYRHCPFIQVQKLSLSDRHFRSGDLLEIIADNVILHVHHVHIESKFCGALESSRLKYLLERCPNMKELTLVIDLAEASNKNIGMDKEQIEKESEDPWPSLKILRIWWCNGKPKEFWSWLWRRCGRVEMLDVRMIDTPVVQSLMEGTLGFMANLDLIQLGQTRKNTTDLTDNEVGVVLSGSRNGWKTVEVKCSAEFQNEAMDSLAKHFHTLEKFSVCSCRDVSDIDLALVLSSSPNLRSLDVTQDDFDWVDLDMYWDDWPTVFKAKKFIDLIPNTSVLKTWLCESSLTVLKILISDIPRPELRSKEAYPGEGRNIQGQVYDRLARLTNLELLWLGLCIDATGSIQYECLEMSLDSGLHKLSTLMKLKELDITRMMTRIGLREVQWMVEHWPDLRIIYGLEWDDIQRERCDDDDQNDEVVEWMREHHPEISV